MKTSFKPLISRLGHPRAALAALLLAGFLAGAAEAGPPRVKPDFKYDATSKVGLVVVLTEPQHVVPGYTIGIYKFSPTDRRWGYGPLKGWSQFARPMGENQELRRFEMTALNP